MCVLVCTAFVNMYQLRASLLAGQPPDAPLPDYIGKPLQTFAFRGINFSHMQGGGYVLSRRAALIVASCRLGAWRLCPSAALQDKRNARADAANARRCDAPATNAEDVYVGLCIRFLHDRMPSELIARPHPCMLTMRAATRHARGRAGHAAAATSTSPQQSLSQAPSGGSAGTASAGALGSTELTTELSAPSQRVLHRFKNHPSCACPITAHPFKERGMLMMARDASIAKGCGPKWEP